MFHYENIRSKGYKDQRVFSLIAGESISRFFKTAITITPTGIHRVHLGKEKNVFAQPKSQLSKRSMKSNLKCSVLNRGSFADSSVASGLVFWVGTKSLAKRGDYPHTQKGDKNE